VVADGRRLVGANAAGNVEQRLAHGSLLALPDPDDRGNRQHVVLRLLRR
jgi:hypothetical protein